jgi:hypothetical protein
LSIGSSITSLITADVFLNISVFAINDVSVKSVNYTLVTLRGSYEDVVFNTMSTILYNTTTNYTIVPTLVKPNCAADANIVYSLPVNSTLTCTLMNSNQTIIKNLTSCTLRSTDNLTKNATYYVRYATVAAISNTTKAINATVKVVTSILTPNCVVSGPATAYSVTGFSLIPTITNKDTVNYSYRWTCNSTGNTNIGCGNYSVINNANTTLTIAKNNLTSNKNYTFIFQILNSNSDVIDTCTKTVYVLP